MMNTTIQGIPPGIGQVSLTALLSRLGYRPVRDTGNEQLYFNVLRDTDTKPCFAVNRQLDVWFDHTLKKGGNLLDFGLAYWQDLGPSLVMEKIARICGAVYQAAFPAKSGHPCRKRKALKLPHYRVQETRLLGENPEISAYLHSEGLWQLVTPELREVYYYVIDEKRRRKDFFAFGWQNENSGWEVRHRYFTGCLGLKGMTFIAGDPDSLAIFEDMNAYLIWKYQFKFQSPSILILNHPEFLAAAKKRAAKFASVAVFFDQEHLNDESWPQ